MEGQKSGTADWLYYMATPEEMADFFYFLCQAGGTLVVEQACNLYNERKVANDTTL